MILLSYDLLHTYSYVKVLIKTSESTLSVRQINNMFWSGEIASVLPSNLTDFL